MEAREKPQEVRWRKGYFVYFVSRWNNFQEKQKKYNCKHVRIKNDSITFSTRTVVIVMVLAVDFSFYNDN